MDFDDLEAKIDGNTRMMFLCNPHNPTGNAWSPEVLKRVGEICLKHNVLLISDEIHSDLIFPGYKHTPVAGLTGEIAANTITCMAASKTFNIAGLSTAYLVISDKRRRAQYEETLDIVHVGAGNILGFTATEAAYNNGDLWLDQLMQYLNGNFRLLNDFLLTHLPIIKAIRPQATYLVWLDCRELGMTPSELKSFMIEEAGLGLNEGLQFGTEGEGFMRINIGCPREILHQALVKLQIAVDKYFQK
jgi:cystathionine beta-lyase